MASRAKPEQETGGAYHRIDEDTGLPYWELWGEGWKDSESLSPGEVMELTPAAFPPGTRIVTIEPDMDTPESQAFYAAIGERRSYYPDEDQPTTRKVQSKAEYALFRAIQAIDARLDQHRNNLALWQSGYLTPTEPDPEERERTVNHLKVAIEELETIRSDLLS